ncbi:uncharacterized protein LOC112268820 [Brachypodium distachyon]|uniref:uncharacterized protein LOC112268820 n=1 Tax=Brachypodium distachyon TaxID=15368 RepID=UPI000D0DDBF7|nr:uncharacterized protein LOC112268820 [Brachypodium distachyon]|eukprot:XP_024310743.1 uncharacterized protein LOC112268820 [Brachypodium distachyon]
MKINTRGTSADEGHDMRPTAGQKMDSTCINNAAQQIHEMHPVHALPGNSDDSDNRLSGRRGHRAINVNDGTIQRIQEPLNQFIVDKVFKMLRIHIAPLATLYWVHIKSLMSKFYSRKPHAGGIYVGTYHNRSQQIDPILCSNQSQRTLSVNFNLPTLADLSLTYADRQI